VTGVQGRKVYYELHGEARGTPLVLVMGMGGSCRGWLPLQVPEFSQHHRTLIFDHRGVGGSDDPGGPFTTRLMADDTAGLLDALGIERADVLGARAGAPIETLVRERLLWTLQDDTLEQQDLIDAMVEFFTRDGAPLTEDLFARQCEACLHHDTADRLRRIRQRTLVLCGRNDALTPPKFHRELADEIPDAHLVTIAHGAHLVMAESAESFNRTVLQFLGDER
jgi:pimeloyl-ACP methyl ester carboxylesterase